MSEGFLEISGGVSCHIEYHFNLRTEKGNRVFVCVCWTESVPCNEMLFHLFFSFALLMCLCVRLRVCVCVCSQVCYVVCPVNGPLLDVFILRKVL